MDLESEAAEMTKEEFLSFIENKRDKRIWEKDGGEWLLKDSILNHQNDKGVDEARLAVNEECKFQITPSAEKDEERDSYLLMGRCYIDKYNYGALLDKPEGGMTQRSWNRPSLTEK